MRPDRAQHVIDAIDGALHDWAVSDDAMRWTPSPSTTPDPPGVVLAQMVAAQEIARRVFEQLGEALRPIIEWGERVAAELGVGGVEFAEYLRSTGLAPRPTPADPWARALQLRRQRNTGPSTDLVHQRRPRLHPHG